MSILTKDEISAMIELAIAGCMRGKVQQARNIIEAILIAYPNNLAAKTGLAFTHIVVDDFATADNLLNEVILLDDSNDDSKGVLVLSKKLQGDLDSAEEIMNTIKDKNSKGYQLAKETLEL